MVLRKIADYRCEFSHNAYWHFVYSYNRLFFHSLIRRGLKARAFNLLGLIKYELKRKQEEDPLVLLFASLLHLAPSVVLFPVKKSGVVQGVPFPIGGKKQMTFAVKWAVKFSRVSLGKVKAYTRVAGLLDQALYNKGDAYDEKDAVYEVALVNLHLVGFYK